MNRELEDHSSSILLQTKVFLSPDRRFRPRLQFLSVIALLFFAISSVCGQQAAEQSEQPLSENDSTGLFIHSFLSAEELSDGWISLFDGETFFGLNSGVFFRCIPGELMNGYECRIQNQFHAGDRTRPFDCGTGGIFRRTEARVVNSDDESWFTRTIIVTGPRVSVWVNGYQVTDW